MSGTRRSAPARGSRLHTAVIAAVAAVATACGPAQNGGVETANPPAAAAVSADSRITLQRLPCFGTCPVYTVDIAADGTVTFDGRRFVAATGVATSTIEPAAAAALMRELVAGGFFDFADRYTYGEKVCGAYHTDAPRVNLTLRVDGRVKTVEHDYGCGDAPPTLRVLQERVDSVAGVERWVGARE